MSEPEISIYKYGWRMPLSIEQAFDYQLISEAEAREMGWTPPPPVPRLRRWKWALQSWWWDHKPHAHLGPCDHRDDA
jgi:hypothetical protein